jgi:hypothetical protein
MVNDVPLLQNDVAFQYSARGRHLDTGNGSGDNETDHGTDHGTDTGSDGGEPELGMSQNFTNIFYES